MRFSTVFSLSAVGTCVFAQDSYGVTGALGDAVVEANNPIGKSGIATFPEKPFFTAGSLDGNVKGSLKATTGPNGLGVDFELTISNLPKEGGPFTYHLHVDPVNAEGNCTATLAHLDPFIRGEEPVCDASKPETCQTGDLSGKYGKITSDPFHAKFHDDYSAMSEGPGSYFLNRSVVVHFANKTRITCANFALLDCPANATATGGACQHPSPIATPTGIPIDNAAGAITVAASLVLVPVVAMVFGM